MDFSIDSAGRHVVTFDGELIREGSWGHVDIGRQRSTMTLYDGHHGVHVIEWETDGGEFEAIGFQTEYVDGRRVLSDYDGIMGWLPEEAACLLEKVGIVVDRDEWCHD